MEMFLKENEIINYSHPSIQKQAEILAYGTNSKLEIARSCFLFVRDMINHSGDFKDDITTYIASDVLKYKTGWCYSKSHLLAALLRANDIPAGLSYQRLHCNEYKEGIYCLHGLNSIYLEEFGWFRVDPRGNKKGVNAQFDPPNEILAFNLEANEEDIPGIYDEPIKEVLNALKQNDTYTKMVNNFPDSIIPKYI